MIDNSPVESHNDFEKRTNPFKKLVDNVKNFIKKNGEGNKRSSFEVSGTEKGPDSDALKYEAYKKREAKRAMRKRRANSNEQKLPAKFKKGW